MDYALITYLILGFGVVMYVVLDGFDLGLGILLPFARDQDARDRMIASVAPVWDGNETWLVLGGATLFAAFPVAYGILLPAWYLPIIAMLGALVLRGVSFEYRPEAHQKLPWSVFFSTGSTAAAFCQGAMLGSYVEGIPVTGQTFAGGPWDWLTPFSVMTGVAVVAGYGLLGATWLILKTDGAVQAWSYRAARPLTMAMLGFVVVVSVWTPFAQPAVATRWFSFPNNVVLAPVPALTALCGLLLWRGLRRKQELAPFVCCVCIFLLALAGFAYSLWPYMVPRSLTVWDAAAPESTQRFILVGVLALIPLVLAYTAHTYRLFRGKTPAKG